MDWSRLIQIHEKHPSQDNGSRTWIYFCKQPERRKDMHGTNIKGHSHPTTQAVMDSSTGDRFVDDNICQSHSRAIDMRFYWVRDRVRQGQFLVYCMVGEHNLADYFTKHHSTSHNWAQRSTYLVPTADTSKYECYMSTNDMRGCVEYLPTRGNRQRKEKVSLLPGKKMDNRWTETNMPNRQTRHRQR